MQHQWQDCTGYSRGEVRGEDARSFSIESGNLQIVITRGHIYHPNNWVMHRNALGIDTHALVNVRKGKEGLTEAKIVATTIVGAKLKELNDSFELIKGAAL